MMSAVAALLTIRANKELACQVKLLKLTLVEFQDRS